MNEEILLSLLKGKHINMDNRIALGIWPHQPITINDCIKVIEKSLDENRFFPYPWEDKMPGDIVDDVVIIEKVDKDKCICRFRSSSPTNLIGVAENGNKIFNNSHEAIKFYLKWGLHLPGDLDGWKVE